LIFNSMKEGERGRGKNEKKKRERSNNLVDEEGEKGGNRFYPGNHALGNRGKRQKKKDDSRVVQRRGKGGGKKGAEKENLPYHVFSSRRTTGSKGGKKGGGNRPHHYRGALLGSGKEQRKEKSEAGRKGRERGGLHSTPTLPPYTFREGGKGGKGRKLLGGRRGRDTNQVVLFCLATPKKERKGEKSRRGKERGKKKKRPSGGLRPIQNCLHGGGKETGL